MPSSFGALTIGIASLAVGCGARTPLSIGGDASAPDAAVPARRVGLIFATTTAPGLSGPERIDAVFYADPIPPACADLGARGTCTVVTCPNTSPMAPSPDAGTITVTIGGAATSMSYDGTRYAGIDLRVPFTTGDTIRVTSAGSAGVPAFDLSTIAPNLVELDPPWFTHRMTIASTDDLALSWGSSPTGDAIFHLTDTSGHVLVCFFDASARRGTVPRAELGAFRSLATDPIDASFYVAARSSVDQSDWTIGASTVVWYGATWSQAGEVTLE